jgi:L-lactate dehydrogenase complex protein LldG
MSERERILGRIREALRVPAPRPGLAHDEPSHAPARSVPPDARQWLPPAAANFDERLELFRKNAAELKADFQTVANRQELAALLLRLRDTEGWKKVGVHKAELTDFAAKALGLPVCRTDQGYDVRDLESCSAGISECDALVAQTGSVLVTSRSSGGRALSVLPPHHVVLARREQLIGDLPSAFELLKQKFGRQAAGDTSSPKSPGAAAQSPPNDYPSFISIITGPSRTGDIERILVLGAHGPKKLTIVCLLGQA